MQALPGIAPEQLKQFTQGLEDCLGCAGCHVPTLMTGPSKDPAFGRKAVNAFSDLLLHDIGTGDGIAQAATEQQALAAFLGSL